MATKNDNKRFFIVDDLYRCVNGVELTSKGVRRIESLTNNWGAWLLVLCGVLALPLLYGISSHRIIKDNRETIASLTTELEETKRDDLIHTLIGKYVTEGHHTPLSDSAVYELCVECGAPYPELIVAQYKLESGTGTSNLAVNANNLVGMKVVQGKRPTTQTKGKEWNGYGVYHNWQLCIIDRILLENWNFKGREFPDETEYRKWISGRYAEDGEYMYKLDSIVRKLKNTLAHSRDFSRE